MAARNVNNWSRIVHIIGRNACRTPPISPSGGPTSSAGGLPHLQETLPLFLTEVAAGRLTIERLVDVTSAAPARIFGIDDRKGAIAIGRDADIVAVDLDAEGELRNEDVLSKCGWTAFDGRGVRGLPRLTLVRGSVVYRDGRVVGRPGFGRVVRPARLAEPQAVPLR